MRKRPFIFYVPPESEVHAEATEGRFETSRRIAILAMGLLRCMKTLQFPNSVETSFTIKEAYGTMRHHVTGA